MMDMFERWKTCFARKVASAAKLYLLDAENERVAELADRIQKKIVRFLLKIIR